MRGGRKYAIGLLILVLVVLTGVNAWVSDLRREQSQRILRELENLKTGTVTDEKTKQEIIKLRIENEEKAIFLNTFITNFSIAASVVVAISGVIFGLFQYLNIRQKEVEENERARLDRGAALFGELSEGIVSDSESARVGGIAGLQHFFSAARAEFHERVALALALAGRTQDSAAVRKIYTPIFESAVRSPELFEAMRKVSWQGLALSKADLSGLDLSTFDLRDCDFESVNFRGAKLVSCRLDAARLVACNFNRADASRAVMEYADLAHSTFTDANLTCANLRNVKILHADFERAVFNGAEFTHHAIDWRLARNWRDAVFDPGLLDGLLRAYGPRASGPRVLMLVWEFPPFITGGGWTAAHYFIHQLRDAGTDLTVALPWHAAEVDHLEFGEEIALLPVGPVPVRSGAVSAYSPYSAPVPAYSPYSAPSPPGGGWSAYDYGHYGSGRSLLEKVSDFARRVVQVVEERNLRFDVVHAHDWVCFEAADRVAAALRCPWIAHFHSIEDDRRSGPQTSDTSRLIERGAVASASRLAAPSAGAGNRLTAVYAAPAAKVAVVPNPIGPPESGNIRYGEFQTKRVVFLGRLSWQKGPDLFVQTAKVVKRTLPKAQFVMWGSGEMEDDVREQSKVREVIIPRPVTIAPGTPAGLYELRELWPLGRHPPGTPVNQFSDNSAFTERERRSVARSLARSGFVASAIDSRGSATHLLEVPGTKGEPSTYYFAAVTGLKTVSSTRSADLVELKGPLDWSNRRRAFEAATVVLVPSRYEPFGYVILEAMQAGVPVIYPTTSGAAEFLGAGEKVDPEKVEEVGQRVIQLLTDKPLWQKTADEQLAAVRAYAEKRHADALLTEWRAIIAGSPTS